jgi:hypothetical protein
MMEKYFNFVTNRKMQSNQDCSENRAMSDGLFQLDRKKEDRA